VQFIQIFYTCSTEYSIHSNVGRCCITLLFLLQPHIGFLSQKFKAYERKILQFVTYCSSLHTAVCYILQFITYCSSLHSAVRYILQFVAFCSSLHSAVRYILQFVTLCSSLHTAVRYILQFVTYCSSLHSAVRYILHFHRNLAAYS
jgi:hypothetical protein